jgi:hypothetical protein
VKRQSRDPLLIELIAAIGAGRIDVGPIHAKRQYVYGWCDTSDGRVRLNPAPHAVEIALHETLHRMRPKWTERSVTSRAKKLLGEMSDQEIDRLYDVIQSVAKVRKHVDTL